MLYARRFQRQSNRDFHLQNVVGTCFSTSLSRHYFVRMVGKQRRVARVLRRRVTRSLLHINNNDVASYCYRRPFLPRLSYFESYVPFVRVVAYSSVASQSWRPNSSNDMCVRIALFPFYLTFNIYASSFKRSRFIQTWHWSVSMRRHLLWRTRIGTNFSKNIFRTIWISICFFGFLRYFIQLLRRHEYFSRHLTYNLF